MKKLILILSVFTLGLFSCKEDEPDTTPVPETANLTLKIEHHFNGTPVNLTDEFITENKDTIKFSQFKYFLSNVTLCGEEVDDLKLENSYYLIDLKDGAIQYKKTEGLEAGDFTSIKVSVGVDSIANHSIVNSSGDLNPASGDAMIWSWATGFKFIKAEGSYKNNDATGNFVLHIGKDSNYKTFHFGGASHDHSNMDHSHGSLSISLMEKNETEIHLKVNLAEMFSSPNDINLETYDPGLSSGSEIMENIKTSNEEGTNGWFELHHVNVNPIIVL